MKKYLQAILQRILGFRNYLFVFSLFIMNTIRWNKNEGDILFFLDLLKPDDIVLDIGANIGIMTGLIGKRVKSGKIYAFEPVPDNYKALKRIVSFLNLKRVKAFELALGNRKGSVELRMPVMKGVRMQGLSFVPHEGNEGYDTPYIDYTVKLTPLDELRDQFDRPIAAIKMDVENYERYVLEGATALLMEDKPIIYCELWDNDNRKYCFDIMTKLGYKIHVLQDKTLIPFQRDKHTHHNFFFLPGN